jgi:hypothetical protein
MVHQPHRNHGVRFDTRTIFGIISSIILFYMAYSILSVVSHNQAPNSTGHLETATVAKHTDSSSQLRSSYQDKSECDASDTELSIKTKEAMQAELAAAKEEILTLLKSMQTEKAVDKVPEYIPPPTMYDEYAQLHNRIVTGQVTKQEMKFVVWEIREYGGAGLGNRIIGFISALAFAMATNRALLVRNDEIFNRVLTHEQVSKNGINWNFDDANRKYAEKNGGVSLDTSQWIPLQVGLNVAEWCGCENAMQSEVPVYSVETTQYFVPCLSHNPNYRQYFKNLHASSGIRSFFRAAMRKYVRLQPHVLSEYNTFVQNVMFPGEELKESVMGTLVPVRPRFERTTVIGVQIRTGHLIRTNHEEFNFFKCAKSITAKLYDEDVLLFQSLRKRLEVNVNEQVKFFIATDSSDVRQHARDVLGKDSVLLFVPSSSGAEHMAAALDMFLLASCDDNVITYPKSTFGSVGVALTEHGHAPYVIHSGSKRANECTQLMTTEPCYHGWYARWSLSCYNKRDWETYEMLNQENCYMCGMFPDGSGMCGSDTADMFLWPMTPHGYEAMREVDGDDPPRERFFLPEGMKLGTLKSKYGPIHEPWFQKHAA